VPLSKDPVFSVTVCDLVPVFVHATVVPTGTVMEFGVNAKSMIETGAVLIDNVATENPLDKLDEFTAASYAETV
jgi:hypothetical protein